MSLGKFLVKRMVQGVFVIWGVVTIAFLLRFLTPGDPVSTLTPPEASQEVRERMARELGLNDPFYVQYWNYITDLAMLDLGTSMRTGRSASAMILHRLPATIELAVAATIVSIVIAIPLGVISARRRHQPADYGATMFSLVGISTPNFWLGIMLLLLIAVPFGPIPTGGRPYGFVEALTMIATDGTIRPLGRWAAAIFLPAITLGTYFTALLTRLTRSGMLEELGKTYVEATRAKGLPETLVLYKHVLRNTLIPIITVLGLQLGTLIGGAVITEQVFSWPGLGWFLIQEIANRDWVLIQGVIIVIGVGFVLINIVVDGLYSYINPRVIAE